MENKIEDYLHLYYGAKAIGKRYGVSECRYSIDGDLVDRMRTIPLIFEYMKPILRPLSSMTEEEMKFLKLKREDMSLVKKMWGKEDSAYNPYHFRYLLSKSFDLFGLIKAGLAIDATTLKSQTP